MNEENITKARTHEKRTDYLLFSLFFISLILVFLNDFCCLLFGGIKDILTIHCMSVFVRKRWSNHIHDLLFGICIYLTGPWCFCFFHSRSKFSFSYVWSEWWFWLILCNYFIRLLIHSTHLKFFFFLFVSLSFHYFPWSIGCFLV